MAIQPIDLQVMYAQSANVSKLAGNVQAAQLAESITQQTTVVQQNLENSKRVHSASDDKANNQKITDKKGGNGSGGFRQNGRNEKSENEESSSQTAGSSSPYLGTIIDIVG
ncbi:MAG: hypothetical protein MJ185_10730 [Treponema sp.]|nr:hypothetical protein [Treponema sp.]